MFWFGIVNVYNNYEVSFECDCNMTWARTHPWRHLRRKPKLSLCILHTVRFQRTLRRIIREHPDVVID